MEITGGFSTVQEMARAVRESAEVIEGKQFSPRPWNRFEPENTEWWIVPSTNWPAYRHGKGALGFSTLFSDCIMCSLFVEKGLGRTAAQAFPDLTRRGLIMDKDWVWFAFVEGLADGRIARAAQAITQETNNPVILYVSAWYASDPTDFDPHPLLDAEALAAECRSPLDSGRVWFSVEDGTLEKLEERCIGDAMSEVAACRKLDCLPAAFGSDALAQWIWYDVYIGTLIRLTRDHRAYGDLWDASDIWHKLLRPWMPWIV